MYYTNNSPFGRSIVLKMAKGGELHPHIYEDAKKTSEENKDNKENDNNGRE